MAHYHIIKSPFKLNGSLSSTPRKKNACVCVIVILLAVWFDTIQRQGRRVGRAYSRGPPDRAVGLASTLDPPTLVSIRAASSIAGCASDGVSRARRLRVRLTCESSTPIDADQLSFAQDVSLHRLQELLPGRSSIQVQGLVQREKLEMITMRLAMRGAGPP